MLLSDVCLCVCLKGHVNIVVDVRTSLIFINLLVFMAPTAIGLEVGHSMRHIAGGAGAFCDAMLTAFLISTSQCLPMLLACHYLDVQEVISVASVRLNF